MSNVAWIINIILDVRLPCIWSTLRVIMNKCSKKMKTGSRSTEYEKLSIRTPPYSRLVILGLYTGGMQVVALPRTKNRAHS